MIFCEGTLSTLSRLDAGPELTGGEVVHELEKHVVKKFVTYFVGRKNSDWNFGASASAFGRRNICLQRLGDDNRHHGEGYGRR